MLFCMRVSVFEKEIFIEDNIYKVENDILLYIIYKFIAIILIPNEYYQLRMQHKFISIKLIRKKHIIYALQPKIWKCDISKLVAREDFKSPKMFSI